MVGPAWRRGTLLALTASAGCASPPDQLGVPPLCAPRGDEVGWFRERDAGLAFEVTPVDFRGAPIAVVDLDGDGRLDLVLGSRAGGLAAYQNLGALGFADVTAALGLSLDEGVAFVAPADLDADGDPDLALATTDALVVLARGAAGYAEVARFAAPAIEHLLPIDLDRDGDLDLHAARRTYDGSAPDLLFLGDGALGLAPWTPPAGDPLPVAGLAFTAGAADVDGDGDLDLHVALDTLIADHGDTPPPAGDPGRPVDRLLASQLAEAGALGFVDRADALGLATPRSSMGSLWVDLDGDERLDLHVTDLGANKAFVAGPAGFVDRADELGLAAPHRRDLDCFADPGPDACLLMSWAAQQGDVDLDGVDDLVVLNGLAVADGYPPPQLVFRGPAPYLEVDAGLGCFEGHGGVLADLDDDGDLDLVATPNAGRARLFENLAPPTDGWLEVELIGRGGNPAGLGAVIEVVLEGGALRLRPVGAGGVAHSAPPARVHVGTGDRAIERVVVRWPSGATETIEAPARGRRLVIAER